jgi:hypothetical protein
MAFQSLPVHVLSHKLREIGALVGKIHRFPYHNAIWQETFVSENAELHQHDLQSGISSRKERGWFRDDDLSAAAVKQLSRAASHFGGPTCGDEIRPLANAARIRRRRRN